MRACRPHAAALRAPLGAALLAAAFLIWRAGDLPGFGQLHPRTQGVTTLGSIYSSSLFPSRAPDGELLVLNYIGGATNTTIGELEQQAVVDTIDTDLREMLLKSDAPKVSRPTERAVRPGAA